jgi:Glycosyltransferase family 87
MLLVWLPRHAMRPDVREVDLYIYYQTALRLKYGEPIYTGFFVYPPMFAALVRPAAALALPVFQASWYAVMVASFWAYVAGLARLAFGRLTLRRVLAVAPLVALTPGTDAIMSFGNIDLMIWALIAWSLPYGGGLAVAGCLKFYPAIVVAAGVIRCPSTGRRQFAAAATLVALSLVVLGPVPFVEWFRAGGVPLPNCTLIAPNVSLSTGILRILHVTAFRGGVARAVYLGVPALLISTTFWVTRRWSPSAAAAAVLITTVWSAPVCWIGWLPILYIPLAVWLRTRLARTTPAAQ